MHALSKKNYCDVMKSGQEDTILESDTSNEDCQQNDTPTSEVGCYARTHLKSNSVQTQWSRNNKNFRNECTGTSDEDSKTSNQQHPLQKTGKTAVFVDRAVECVNFFQFLKKVFPMESKATITAKGDDESTQCECVQSKMRICNCDEYQNIPSNRAVAACRTFSLGSPESRRLQNEHCKTKLIGGCRVPVCKNYKSRF